MWAMGRLAVGFHEMQHLRDRGREIHHAQIVVEEYGGDLRALEEILEVAGGARQFLDTMRQLAIDGGQLLVDRLQLLTRSLELLVRRLKLLVERLVFLVRGFQLFIGALQLLDGGLEALPRRAQLAFETLDMLGAHQRIGIALIGLEGADRAVLEQDDEITMAMRRRPGSARR